MSSTPPDTTTKKVGRCGIYERRPELCKVYPKLEHYVPEECTFWFAGADRQGECSCDVSACCAVPRVDGEPGGAPMPAESGGMPCKHIVWEEKPDESTEKTASALPIVDHSLEEAVGGPDNS